jgi:hypothetical protein
MKRLSLLTLAFAVLSLVFFLLLVFLRIPFPLYPLMSWQDALDILTPLALIPLYWLLFKIAAGKGPILWEEIAFMLLAALWVEGQGMHLAANSINNLIENLAEREVIDIQQTYIYQLTYFYDEYLSHYLWHLGVVGLAALLVYRDWKRPDAILTLWWAAILAGLLYGFTLFCIFLEGQTLALGLPFVLIITLFGVIWGRKHLGRKPLLAFFFISCLVAALMLVGWGLYWGGFPQFTDVGLI